MNKESQYNYQNIFETFDSSENGLESGEAEYRIKKYGLNKLTVSKKRPLILSFLDEYRDPMIILLLFATVIAFISGDTTDAIIIFVVVMLNGIISFVQKYKAEKAVEALKKMVSPQARAIRNRQQVLLDTEQIVPGDLIILNEGDTIPADAIVFAANELQTSEAILTGESFPVPKRPFDTVEKGNLTQKENMIFTGTTVARGNAHALVIKTGMETEFGKIANLTHETEKDETPLEKEIHKIGIFAAQISLVIIALIFIFELLVHQRPIVDNILFAASIAVAAVPEGLPAVITIALALGVQRLSKKKAIIRQLSSVETLGATTVICTDKTGTLTRNEMTVTEALLDDFYINFEGIGYAPQGNFKIYTNKEDRIELNTNQLTPEFFRQNHKVGNALKWFSLCAELCNNSKLVEKNNTFTILGDPTEGGLLTMSKKISSSTSEEMKENLEEILELPFDSERKMMSKIFADHKHGKYYIFCKGAPESIVGICDQRLHGGRMAILTKDTKATILGQNETFNESALRTIGISYKEISGHEVEEILNLETFEEKQKKIEKKLVFIGIAGLLDPPRKEIKEAVRLTKVAGIRSYIVTGDHGFTTAAIAKQVGLISDDRPHEIITGEEIDNLSDQDIKDKFKDKEKNIIFSRTRPEHKLRIVSILKEMNEIVAVTGDGVNDAPALKRADIGIAMGVTGSDVSKEAANMVLMDDSFRTIVTAVEEGRVIFANLKKFIFYIFSSNIGELFIIFVSLIIGLESPLTAILILTINFITDLFPALALGVEPAEKDIMSKPPRHSQERIMNKAFIKRILITGVLIGILMLGGYIFKLVYGGWTYGTPVPEKLMSEASSLTFIIMVLLQVTNSFNAKTENKSIFRVNPLNNHKLIWANLSSVLIAIAVVELPFFQNFFHTSSLQIIDWLVVLAGCIIITIFLEIIKLFGRRTAAKTALRC
jgi:P-type Ca2+ transporter type 2C